MQSVLFSWSGIVSEQGVKDTSCIRWQLCKLENNIYRASHLISFITKSRTPGSPMKLGVNPSSASLFSSSPTLPDPGLYLTSSHLRSAKDIKEKFCVIGEKKVGTVSNVKVTLWIIKDQRLQLGAGRGGASFPTRGKMMDKLWGHSDISPFTLIPVQNKPVRFIQCKSLISPSLRRQLYCRSGLLRARKLQPVWQFNSKRLSISMFLHK